MNVNATEIILLNTPLHLAASLGEAGVVGLLLQKGADVTLVNRKGERPVDRYVHSLPPSLPPSLLPSLSPSLCLSIPLHLCRRAWGKEGGREGGREGERAK